MTKLFFTTSTWFINFISQDKNWNVYNLFVCQQLVQFRLNNVIWLSIKKFLLVIFYKYNKHTAKEQFKKVWGFKVEIGSQNVEVHWICVIWQKQKYYITFVHGCILLYPVWSFKDYHTFSCWSIHFTLLAIAVPYFTCLCSTIAYSRGYVRNSVHETFTKIEVSFFLHAPWIL